MIRNFFVKKNIIPSQHVKQIKQKMKDLEKPEKEKEKDEKVSHFSKIIENIKEIFNLPIDFLYKFMIINGSSLFYKFT